MTQVKQKSIVAMAEHCHKQYAEAASVREQADQALETAEAVLYDWVKYAVGKTGHAYITPAKGNPFSAIDNCTRYYRHLVGAVHSECYWNSTQILPVKTGNTVEISQEGKQVTVTAATLSKVSSGASHTIAVLNRDENAQLFYDSSTWALYQRAIEKRDLAKLKDLADAAEKSGVSSTGSTPAQEGCLAQAAELVADQVLAILDTQLTVFMEQGSSVKQTTLDRIKQDIIQIRKILFQDS